MILFDTANIGYLSFPVNSTRLMDTDLLINRKNKYIPLLKIFTGDDTIKYQIPIYWRKSTYFNYYYVSELFMKSRSLETIIKKNYMVVGRGFLGVKLVDTIIPLVVVMVKGSAKRSMLKPSNIKVLVSKEFYDNKKDYRSEKIWANRLIRWCGENGVRVVFKNNIHDDMFISVKAPSFHTIREMKDYCDGMVKQFRQSIKDEKRKKTKVKSEKSQECSDLPF